MSHWHLIARDMRANGMTLKQIADEFGVTKQAVSYALNDPDREKRRAYHRNKYRHDAEYRAKCIARVNRHRAKRAAE